MTWVRVFTPDSAPELMTVVAMLEAHDIPCFVQNEALGSLFPGPQIHPYSTRAIMVPEERVRDALELLRDFQSGSPEPSPSHPP